MGWPVGYSNELYGFGAYVTPELQAQYLVRAYEIIRTEWHWVEVAIVWHLNTAAFGPDPSGFANFSLTDADGDPGPAYKAIAGLVAEWRVAAGQ
jgi:hypothetical protein